MRSVPFREVLETVLAHCGQKYDGTLTVQQSILINFLNRHVARFWNWGPWPEWTYSENRPFADEWSATPTYLAGAVVYLPATELYYTALLSGTNQNPETATTYWSATTLTTREVAYDQYGKAKIGNVWIASNADTHAQTIYRTYPRLITATGIRFPGVTLNTIWLRYSTPPARYTSKAHDTAAAYARYDLVLSPGASGDTFPSKGEVYQADLSAAGTQIWVWVPFPAVAFGYVVQATAADMQRYYGKTEEAAQLIRDANEDLYLEASKAGIGTEIVVER